MSWFFTSPSSPPPTAEQARNQSEAAKKRCQEAQALRANRQYAEDNRHCEENVLKAIASGEFSTMCSVFISPKKAEELRARGFRVDRVTHYAELTDRDDDYTSVSWHEEIKSAK